MNKAADKRWRAAVVASKKAHEAKLAAMRKALPVGRIMTIERGRGRFDVEIIGVSEWHDTIFVRNLRTGKEYRLAAFWFLREHGGEI